MSGSIALAAVTHFRGNRNGSNVARVLNGNGEELWKQPEGQQPVEPPYATLFEYDPQLGYRVKNPSGR